MITFSRLGKDGMKLGNQLHQIASLIGFSEKYNCELVLPEWKYAQYFIHPPVQANIQTDFFIKEESYHYVPEFWDKYADVFQTKNTDILGFLQSEKYWLHCRDKVHKAFSFKEEFTEAIKSKFKAALSKKVIAISIRRGDFITSPNHYLLPLDYYLKALVNFFQDYREFNIIIFSDDIDYCALHIKHLPNIYFSSGLDAIEQLCLMSLCDHFIISNSTFSWWGAMLGEKNYSKIIRPAYHFEGELSKSCDWKDYYPERWILYDHLNDNTDISKLIFPEIISSFLLVKMKFINFLKKNGGKLKSRIGQGLKKINAQKVSLERKAKILSVIIKIEFFEFWYGKPEHVLTWGRGVGDNLLMTPGIYEYYLLKKKKVWVISFFPEIFKHNSSVIVFKNRGIEEYAFKKKGYKVFLPHYLNPPGGPPDKNHHIIRQIADHLNVTIPDDKLKPVYYLDKSELYNKKTKLPLIVIQSTSLNGHFPMTNKQWYPQRFQEVVNSLKDQVEFVQIGMANDDKLDGVSNDLRGVTSVREAITAIATADLFVGLIGFYMHAAKAVNTKAIIIYGGREHPLQSGYADNINIFTPLPCSPCWKWNECDYDRKCMSDISSFKVITLIKECLNLNE